MPERAHARLLVVDLDETLWPWFDPWHASFSVLLDGLVAQSGIPEAQLSDEIRQVHQQRGTTDYLWLVEEVASLRGAVPEGQSIRAFYAPSLQAQSSAMLAHTRLREGVRETLEQVKAGGTKIVAYTESLDFWTRWRIVTTGLDGILDEYYSRTDHDAPTGPGSVEAAGASVDGVQLKHTQHRYVDADVLKPAPEILGQIIAEHGVRPEETVYVGDTLMKDVVMAQRAGALDVWAEYGLTAPDDPRYELLLRVSHWTDEMVRKAQEEHPGVRPTLKYVLRESFSELLDLFSFGPTEGSLSHRR